MKGRDRKPTRIQKEYISGSGLEAENWLVRREDEGYLYLVSRKTGRNRKISKEKKERRPYGKNR